MRTKELQMTLAEKMEMVRMSVRAVTREYKISRLVTGDAGIGKSYSVIQELNAEEATYIHITGGVKDAKALYITLYKHNSPGMIIVFDDVNDILRRRECTEILRACVTNEPERKVAYIDNKILLDGTKSYHPQMVFKSRIIIITNIPKRKIDSAILSRTSPIEVHTNKDEMIQYVKENIENAPPRHAKLEWKMEAMEYIQKMHNEIRHFDFRVFEDVMLWVMAEKDSDNPNSGMWKKYAFSILT